MARSRHRSSAVPLALAWTALVLYASLFPFSGWHWPPGMELGRVLRLPWPPWLDVFDLWANLLGYLPLGLLLLIGARRSGLSTTRSLLVALLLPSLLSYTTEVTQTFLPGRHPSLKDWAMNSAGALAGALLGLALFALGALDRWHAWRERWFVGPSAGALTLLALWPVGLLFPTPAPLGEGQVGERLREALVDLLEDVPWADGAYRMLANPPERPPLWPPAEAAVTVFGLLAPCLVAFAVVAPGRRRIVLVAGAGALAFGTMTLSTLLNFGPEHAFAWLAPVVLPSLLGAMLLAALLAPVSRRIAAALGLVALTGLVTLVAQAPSDPYFAQSLQAWEQGRFVHFHGLAQWVGWLWPYGAMTWLLSRLAARS